MNKISLTHLGWKAFYQQQLSLQEWETTTPARVAKVHRSELKLLSEQGESTLTISAAMPAITVGDWLLLERGRFDRLLERASLFSRKAPGSKAHEQLLAANVDTAFIVCSLNDNFSLNRIERYLALCHDAGADPAVVLSKMDLCEEADDKRQLIQQLDSHLCVESVNGLDRESTAVLQPWCKAGQTIVLLGSSGAGKSTLTNTLLGHEAQATGGIREQDSKGRHTTSSRALLSLPSGAQLIDTPGLRELQLAVDSHAIDSTFGDISELAANCRFSDCQHTSEPGCAVLKALEREELDERRYRNYLKLHREQSRNQATLAERHQADRDLAGCWKTPCMLSVA